MSSQRKALGDFCSKRFLPKTFFVTMAARFVDGKEEDIVQPKLRPTSSNSRQKDEEDISELRAIFYTRKQKFSLTFSPSRERKVVKSTNENGKNFSC